MMGHEKKLTESLLATVSMSKASPVEISRALANALMAMSIEYEVKDEQISKVCALISKHSATE